MVGRWEVLRLPRVAPFRVESGFGTWGTRGPYTYWQLGRIELRRFDRRDAMQARTNGAKIFGTLLALAVAATMGWFIFLTVMRIVAQIGGAL